MILRKYQEGGDLTPENLDGILAGEVMPQTGAEARAAAVRGGKKSYYWAGTTIPLTDQDLVAGNASPQTDAGAEEEIPTARSRAIAEAKLAGKAGYTFGGADLPYPPTSAAAEVQSAWGINPGEDLSYANLDSIVSGETMPQTRDEAFAAARRSGQKSFEWGGSSYHTKTKEDVDREQRETVPAIMPTSPMEIQPMESLLTPDLAQGIRRLTETDEFQGILRGPERRKANRQKRQENRKEGRAKNQARRKENRQDRKETRQGNRAERKEMRK